MTPEDGAAKRAQLRQAIAAQEGLRGTLDEAIVDATIAALRRQLAELETSPAPEQERKLMTVLFTDIVGSTRLLRTLDPEEGMVILDSALQRLAEPIERRGGRVLRFMGDGFLAAFGLGRARENDPEMAVRAGLGLLEAAQKIADELASERRLDGFRIRVGINTGLVLAGGVTEGDATLAGVTVHLAARLESAAPPGGLLISQGTYQHVRGLFEVEPSDEIEAQGFSQPVRVYRVLGARPRTFGLTTRGLEGVETSMIGRDGELRSLQGTMSAVAQGGSGRFVTVVAGAGLGKSRLLDEFERWLERQAMPIELLKGRATLETLELPYGLLRELISQRAGILEDDRPPAVADKIAASFERALGPDAHTERNAHVVAQLLGYDLQRSPHLESGLLDDPRQLRDSALAYLDAYLAALAAQRTLVVFLDDLHWADGSSLDVLLQLFDQLSHLRLLIVGLTRPGLYERRPAWGGGPNHQRLDLRPLSERQSRRLVGEILHKVDDLPEALRDLIVENAEGNPFYLEELIKMLIEDGAIVKGAPRWRVEADRLDAIRIPATLTGVIQARVEALPEREHRILQQASVVGRIFWDETICYLNRDDRPGGAIHPDEARQRLGALQAREMILEQESSAFTDTAEYLFQHALLREVTYESVLRRLRREYHGLVADWLIAQSAERAAQVSGLIAGHLERAERREEAVEYLRQAAEAAAANYALSEAVEFYGRALALTPEQDREGRYQLLHGRMEVLSSQANRVSERADLEALSSLVADLDDDRLRAQNGLDWSWFSFWIGDFVAMKGSAERAIDLARSAELSDLTASAHYALAWADMQMGDHREALVHAQTVIVLAQESNDPLRQWNGLTALGLIHSAIGNYSAGRAHLERALATVREQDPPQRIATSRTNLAVTLTLMGDYRSAQELLLQDLDVARANHSSVDESTALVNLAWVSSARGEWEDALEYAQAGLELKRTTDHKEALAEGLLWLGHAWMGLAQPQRAIDAYRESLEIRHALDQANLAMVARAGLARAEASRGEATTAVTHIEEILAYLAQGGDLQGTWEPLRIYLTCFQVLDQHDDARAESILQAGYDLLLERAARIADEADRRRYLEAIPWHHELATIGRARLGAG